MDATDTIAIVFGTVGALTGVVGLLSARRANSHARDANEIAKDAGQEAKKANGIAAQAVTVSEEANRIAHDANQLAQEANTVTKRQADYETEQWLVDWEPKWKQKGATLVLMNTGGDIAHDVTIVVHGEDLHEVRKTGQDVQPGDEISFTLPKIREQRSKRARSNARATESMASSGFIYVPSSFQTKLEVTISWKTGQGFPRDKRLEIVAT